MSLMETLLGKKSEIDNALGKMLQDKRALERDIREEELSKGVTLFCYDDVDFSSRQQFRAFCGQGKRTNLVTPGMISEDAAGEWKIGHLLVGGSVETLKAWAGQVMIRPEIGGKTMLEMFLWNKPDAVLTPEDVRELSKEAETPEYGNEVWDVPSDWRFLYWSITPTWPLRLRQTFCVAFESFEDVDFPNRKEIPKGEVRVILGGAIESREQSSLRAMISSGVRYREELRVSYYDTLREAHRPAFGDENIGHRQLSNAVVTGVLYSDNTMDIGEILIGAPTETFNTWDSRNWDFLVGGKPAPILLAQPSDLVETIVGWTFLRIHPAAPIHVAARQTIQLRVHGTFKGALRVVFNGNVVRDLQ